MHWISAGGLRLPGDGGEESSMWYWSNHWDMQVCKKWYLLSEMNWYSWFDSGNNPALNTVEGGDLWNFGSTNVDGNDIVTNAYEFPLTNRSDVLENRMTFDFILRY